MSPSTNCTEGADSVALMRRCPQWEVRKVISTKITPDFLSKVEQWDLIPWILIYLLDTLHVPVGVLKTPAKKA